MELENLLSENKAPILKRWLKYLLETYPEDSQRFLKAQKDPFANPVRHAFEKDLHRIYNDLLTGMDRTRVAPFLDNIIGIRAVQDFSPSRAISFIFDLKQVIREALSKEIGEKNLQQELLDFDRKIDECGLLAFDVFMERREKLYELRANEAKNQVNRLLLKKGLVAEIPPWGPSPKEGEVN